MSIVRRLVVGLVAAAVMAAGTGRSDAQEVEEPVDPLAPAVMSPDLADVEVDSTLFRELDERFVDARNRRVQAEADLVELDAAEARLVVRVEQAAVARHRAVKRLAYIRGAIQQVAIEDYTQGRADDDSASPLDLDSLSQAQQRQVLVDAVNEAQFADEAEAEEVRDAAVREHQLSRA